MPKFVIDKIKSFDIVGDTLSDDVGMVSVLFCDIADFDEVIKEQQDDIVRILDGIFRKFDEFSSKHGIQKIETVGKTYMAASGLKWVENSLPKELRVINHTSRLVSLAKDMIMETNSFKLPGNKDLKLKIGIHHGEAMMGVIGYHKPQFSLIGDTVNTTSRHCTTGSANHVMLSEAAWNLVKNGGITGNGFIWNIVPTFMKGKGDVPVYHLFQKKGNFKSKLFKALDKQSAMGDGKSGVDSEFTKLGKLKKFEHANSGMSIGFYKFHLAMENMKKVQAQNEIINQAQAILGPSPSQQNVKSQRKVDSNAERNETEGDF